MEYLIATGSEPLQKGRIPGVVKVGLNYLIPENIPRPVYSFFVNSGEQTSEKQPKA